MDQLFETAFWSKHNELFGSLPIKPKEVRGKRYADLATVVAGRIATLDQKRSSLPKGSWERNFVAECEAKEQELRNAWEEGWPKLCNGKTLLNAFHKEVGFKESISRLKIRIIKSMESEQSELWKEIEQKLRTLVD